MRLKLVVGSLVLHVVVALVLWAQSVWNIDQLDRGRDRLANLAVFNLPAPPAAGTPHPKPPSDIVPKPKTHVTHDTVQPHAKTDDKPAIDTPPGEDHPGEITDTPIVGKCENPPCGFDDKKEPEKKPDPPPPPVKKPKIVKPSDLEHIRFSGETQVHPSEVDKMAIIRAGNRSTSALFLVCVDDRGSVSSVTLKRSSGFSDYDARLTSAIQGWRYRPYMQDGVPQAICSTVTFDYRM